MRVDFYYLTRTPIERALPAIAEKVYANGDHLSILGNRGLLEALDEALWSYKPTSFLPHGREGDQPILLSENAEDAKGFVAYADGIWRDPPAQCQRVFYFFDQATVENARSAWRSLAESDGLERKYWKQDENGRWVEGP